MVLLFFRQEAAAVITVFLRFSCTGFFRTDFLFLSSLFCFLKDRFLQCGQSLAAQCVDSAHRQENIVICLNLQTGKCKQAVPGLFQTAQEVFLCHRSSGSGLHRGAGDLYFSKFPVFLLTRILPGPVREHYGEPCGLSCSEHSLSHDLARGKTAQVLSAYLLLQSGISPGIPRFSDRHKVPAVLCMIIPGTKPGADIETAEPVQILFFHCPGRRSSGFHPCITAVDIFAIDGCHAGRVDRLFHTAFDLERIDPGIDQFGQDRQDTHIFHRERPDFFSARIRTRRLSVFIKDPEGQAAGPGTPAAVSAPSAQKTGHQTPAGIRIAHCTVDKSLDLDGLCRHCCIFPAEGLDLLQGQFSGRHNPAHAKAPQKTHRVRRSHGHLCTGMQREVGTCFMEGAQNTDVLHDHAVQTGIIQLSDKGDEVRKFILASQDIGRQVHLPVKHMSLSDRPDDLLCGKIVRVSPCTKALSSQIDCVRTGAEGTGQGFPAACRCQEFDFVRV